MNTKNPSRLLDEASKLLQTIDSWGGTVHESHLAGLRSAVRAESEYANSVADTPTGSSEASAVPGVDLLPIGTVIISWYGETSEVERKGEVHTGPSAEGYIAAVLKEQENCYSVVFHASSVTIFLSSAELADLDRYEVRQRFADNEVVGFDDATAGDAGDRVIVQWGADNECIFTASETLADFGIANLREHELHRVGVTREAWEQAKRDVSVPTSDGFNNQDLSTILAALRYYQHAGQGDPENRSDDIHDIATDGDREISMDASGIDDLCERLKFSNAFQAN